MWEDPQIGERIGIGSYGEVHRAEWNGTLEKLSDKQCTPESQLKFILEAWLQSIECRRVLEWTYAYGYYLPDHELAKRQSFGVFVREVESGLERLHQCVEDIVQFLNSEDPSKDFNDFRTKLLTRLADNPVCSEVRNKKQYLFWWRNKED